MVEGRSFQVIRHRFIGYIYLGVLQMGSNIPKDVLVRWKTYGFEQYSLHRGIWDMLSPLWADPQAAVTEEVNAMVYMMTEWQW